MASMTLKKKPMTKDAFLKEWGKHSAPYVPILYW